VKTDIPAQAGGIGSNLCTGVRAFGFAKSFKRPADRLFVVVLPERYLDR
jgi:hypothetical protein